MDGARCKSGKLAVAVATFVAVWLWMASWWGWWQPVGEHAGNEAEVPEDLGGDDLVDDLDDLFGAGNEIYDMETLDICPAEAVDLMMTDTPTACGLVEGPLVTLDSGATNPVADPDKHFPGTTVVPSEASRKGVVYQGPGTELIPNVGEFREKIMTQEGTIANTVWQAAKVRKPLMAVSACEDKGNLVVFDKGASCILSGTNPEIAEIRRLIRQATRKVKVDRTGGTYTFRMWRVPKDFSKPEGFQGPVKR